MREQRSFGQWLKGRRKRLDLTREEVAACVGCSLATVEKVETGERRPSRQIAELLAGCLQIGAEHLPAFMSFARGEAQFAPNVLTSLSDPAGSHAALLN